MCLKATCFKGRFSDVLKQSWIWCQVKKRTYTTKIKNEKKGKTGDKAKEVAEKPKEPCMLPEDLVQPSVIIIGAGMAGLSAAQRLTQCGLRRFRVLEGSERPGGRIKTGWLSDSVVELGSQWISGASVVNPVFTMAVQEKLIDCPLTRTNEPEGLIFNSNGRAVGQEIMEVVRPRFWAMASKAAGLFSCTEELGYKSLSGYFDEMLTEDLKSVLNSEHDETKQAFYGLFSSLKAKIGEDLTNVNAKFFGSFHEVPGGNVRIRLGMGGLLAPMLRSLPACSVVYCKPVHCVRWGAAGPGNPRAVVVCCDGEEIGADYVIVTVPLGVLKARENFFCPDLPAKKMDAIRDLGVGHVDKIFMQYDVPFWDARNGGMRLAWTPHELRMKDGWQSDVCEFSGVQGSKKVLCATMAGEGAKIMEGLDDTEVIRGLTRTLRQFTNDRSIPPPTGIMRSSWSTFPYSFGAYTCMNLDSSTGNIRDIASPLPDECDLPDVPPILLFAGEHTHSTEYATLQGARRSGFREADRIIRLTIKYKGSPNKEPPCPPC